MPLFGFPIPPIPSSAYRTMDHPDWPAFLAAIVDSPDDDTVRLVAADFLEESGDPERAAFIRVQIALARLEAEGLGEGPEAQPLLQKERGFIGPLSMYRTLWAAEACPELVKLNFRGGGRDPLEAMSVEGADRVRWQRGFVHGVRCSGQEWQRHGAALRRRQPIREVSLTDCDALMTPDWLGMLPSLRGLESLRTGSSHDWPRLEWLRRHLPEVRVTPLRS